MANYWYEPYIRLLPCANKVLSAWTEVWSGSYRSSKRFWFPEVVLGRFCDFEILGEDGDIKNSISMANYWYEPYIRLFPGANKVSSAWTEVWFGTCRSSTRFCFPEVVLGRFSRFLGEGEAGDINNSTSTANYCNGPYIRLLPCANKVFSAWTEVSSCTCRSSRRYCFPGVAPDRFSIFLRFLAGLVI